MVSAKTRSTRISSYVNLDTVASVRQIRQGVGLGASHLEGSA